MPLLHCFPTLTTAPIPPSSHSSTPNLAIGRDEVGGGGGDAGAEGKLQHGKEEGEGDERPGPPGSREFLLGGRRVWP